MALKPNLDPKWSTDNNPLDNVEPDTTYKEKGIAAGSTWTRQWLNWMFYSISQWIDWVRSYAMDKDQNLNDLVDKPTARTNLGLNDPTNTLGANIQTANKWKTARTLSLTGHVTGSVSVDGSGDASISTTLANSGVTAGTYPKVTVDVKGRVTAGSSLVASDIPTLNQNTTGSAGSAPWSGITGKPAAIGAGATALDARKAIGATGNGLESVWIGWATSLDLDTLPGGHPGQGWYVVSGPDFNYAVYIIPGLWSGVFISVQPTAPNSMSIEQLVVTPANVLSLPRMTYIDGNFSSTTNINFSAIYKMV